MSIATSPAHLNPHFSFFFSSFAISQVFMRLGSELGVIVVALFHFSLPNLAIALRAPNSVLATAGIIQMQVNSMATPLTYADVC
jgi:hypothetical protein